MTTQTKKPTRVLVLGGGYVAIWFTKAVRRAVKRGELELTVVDRNNYHTFHGLVPEMLVGKIQAGQIISPARRLFWPGRFIAAEVDTIDIEKKQVTISRVIDGRPSTLEYDHLVLNLGSVDDLARYRGVAEHTMRLKGYFDCIRVRNHILAMLEMAELEPDAEERKRLLHFVIAGGNYAGIETAAELSSFVRQLAKRDFPGLKVDEVTITIVHSGPYVLPELGREFPQLSAYAERVLKARGVTIEHDVKLQSATPHEAVLSDGRRLATRSIISCTGTAQSPLLDKLPFERDATGRLKADAYGRVSEQHQVWSAGDCSTVPMKNGKSAPPLALYAMHGGATIGKNLLRSLKGKALKPYGFTGMGDCCVLGAGDAVGQIWGIPLKGVLAWLTWRSCMILYLPTWAKRLRTLLDWLVVPFFGPDIASVNASDSVGVVRHLFESGQDIIRQGEVGRAMYIIQAGRVEVVQQKEGVDTRVAELGPGEHFGEIAVLKDTRRTATVRALEPVTLLRISREETRMLTQSFKAFGEIGEVAQSRAEGSA
jgi:NADH dehydrogenase